MTSIVECVPNFSEGRDAAKIEAIVEALVAGRDVYLLDREMDADHNRSVITLVGTCESIGEAALRGIERAARLIDLNQHQGAHPRLGATDVVPFVPVRGASLADCVRIAEWVGAETWRRFRIPVYLYEAAARRPERRNLENIRRGQFEGVREEVRTHPERRPDFGEASLHPTAGATVVGARKFLIAYNINLATSDVSVARSIAKKIRTSSGGLPCVKAMGVDLKARGLSQVSMNLTDFETTPVGTVFDAVEREASARGAKVQSSEIVGLIPRRALEDAAVHYLKVENFRTDLILEDRLQQVLETSSARTGATAPERAARALQDQAQPFVDAVASDAPTPGGGSVSALAGALAAALGEMVCRLTLNKQAFAEHHEAARAALARLGDLRRRLMQSIDDDAASYEGVVQARRMPKATAEEKVARASAIEAASKQAACVPLETARLTAEVGREIEPLRAITAPQAASDLTVALHLVQAGRVGAMENVRANLPGIHDAEWLKGVESQLREL